jgi:hypothetical protein
MPEILAIQEVKIRKVMVQGQARQKIARTNLNQWLSMVVHACHPSYRWKHK